MTTTPQTEREVGKCKKNEAKLTQSKAKQCDPPPINRQPIIVNNLVVLRSHRVRHAVTHMYNSVCCPAVFCRTDETLAVMCD